jgi:glycosyltransferase involved in cell wall biosynthesis
MPPAAPNPLVSIIVRTMGRPELREALDSAVAQTHRPIDLVVVDAGDRGIRIGEHSGVPVRVVRKGRLPRAAAANAGLEASAGDWILFLDEDDAVEPDHVAQLLEAARRSNARVAYSQTRILSADGGERLLGGPYDREFLLRSNYLAIHAVLFSRALVDAGHRFDERFEIFEDWDFWLQLTRHGPFAFTGKPTAIYRVDAGTSGAGGGMNLDRGVVMAQRERILEKWGSGRI